MDLPKLAITLPLLALGRHAARELGATSFSTPGVALALIGSLAMPAAFLLAGMTPGLPSVTAGQPHVTIVTPHDLQS